MPIKQGKLENLSQNDLKKHLKEIGMSQAGDKGTLLHRAKLYQTCLDHGLNVGIGNPCLLKIGDLRKEVSKHGLSPIGSQDELLTSFVDYLKNNQKSLSNVNKEQNLLPTTSASTQVDAVSVARRILELDEVDDYEGILSLGGATPITKTTPASLMRKAYLKLSLLVHPDKISRVFEQATKAFQALVRAFERLSAPDVEDETVTESKSDRKKSDTTKVKAISRSNEGCFRTRLCCPRCKVPWSEDTLDGNPNYFYNFMMTGLKQYTCSTCLFEFGCLTAIHKCPFCQGVYEYSPQDYHRKITCGNENCKKAFGFYLFDVSDRVMKELKKQIRDEQLQRQRVRESKQRRAERLKRSSGFEEESAFVMGLIDYCPRCGEFLEDYGDDDGQRRHLLECTDESKHHSYKQKKMKAEKKEQDRSQKQAQQESIQSRAVWELLGAQTNQLWLLDEDQLRRQAVDMGLEASGDKDDIIAAIASTQPHAANDSVVVSTKRKMKMITAGDKDEEDGTSTNNNDDNSKKRRMTADSVPSNLHSLSVSQLRGICAAHGFKPKGKYKADIIDEIQDELCGENTTENRSLVAVDLTDSP